MEAFYLWIRSFILGVAAPYYTVVVLVSMESFELLQIISQSSSLDCKLNARYRIQGTPPEPVESACYRN